jgi:hypothetical protein
LLVIDDDVVCWFSLIWKNAPFELAG